MAEDKDKGGKPETKTGEKTGFFRKFLEPFFSQVTDEYTRPVLKIIPQPILLGLKSMGVRRMLPIISVGLSGLLQQKETWWGKRIGDIISEGSAELGRLMDEAGEGDTAAPESAKGSEKTKGGALNVLLSSELADDFLDLLKALTSMLYDDTGKEKISEKEKNDLFAMLNNMGPKELYNFLSLEEDGRQALLKIFFTKAKEKSLEESIKELKANIQKTKVEWKVINDELLKPAWDTVKPKIKKVGSDLKKLDEENFGPNSEICERTTGLRSWSKKLRDAELAKH